MNGKSIMLMWSLACEVMAETVQVKSQNYAALKSFLVQPSIRSLAIDLKTNTNPSEDSSLSTEVSDILERYLITYKKPEGDPNTQSTSKFGNSSSSTAPDILTVTATEYISTSSLSTQSQLSTDPTKSAQSGIISNTGNFPQPTNSVQSLYNKTPQSYLDTSPSESVLTLFVFPITETSGPPTQSFGVNSAVSPNLNSNSATAETSITDWNIPSTPQIITSVVTVTDTPTTTTQVIITTQIVQNLDSETPNFNLNSITSSTVSPVEITSSQQSRLYLNISSNAGKNSTQATLTSETSHTQNPTVGTDSISVGLGVIIPTSEQQLPVLTTGLSVQTESISAGLGVLLPTSHQQVSTVIAVSSDPTESLSVGLGIMTSNPPLYTAISSSVDTESISAGLGILLPSSDQQLPTPAAISLVETESISAGLGVLIAPTTTSSVESESIAVGLGVLIPTSVKHLPTPAPETYNTLLLPIYEELTKKGSVASLASAYLEISDVNSLASKYVTANPDAQQSIISDLGEIWTLIQLQTESSVGYRTIGESNANNRVITISGKPVNGGARIYSPYSPPTPTASISDSLSLEGGLSVL